MADQTNELFDQFCADIAAMELRHGSAPKFSITANADGLDTPSVSNDEISETATPEPQAAAGGQPPSDPPDGDTAAAAPADPPIWESAADINDAFRNAFPDPDERIPGLKHVSPGIATIGGEAEEGILTRIAMHADFPPEIDEAGDHSAGQFDHPDHGAVYWMIDVFANEDCEEPSPAPLDPQQSFRVLSAMLFSELDGVTFDDPKD